MGKNHSTHETLKMVFLPKWGKCQKRHFFGKMGKMLILAKMGKIAKIAIFGVFGKIAKNELFEGRWRFWVGTR